LHQIRTALRSRQALINQVSSFDHFEGKYHEHPASSVLFFLVFRF